MARELRFFRIQRSSSETAKKKVCTNDSTIWLLFLVGGQLFRGFCIDVSFQNGTKIQRVDGHSSDRCEHVRYSSSNNHCSVENDPKTIQYTPPKKLTCPLKNGGWKGDPFLLDLGGRVALWTIPRLACQDALMAEFVPGKTGTVKGPCHGNRELLRRKKPMVFWGTANCNWSRWIWCFKRS